jgi:hypothetical protein
MPDLPEDSYNNDVMTFALGNVLPQPIERPEPGWGDEAAILATQAAVAADLTARRLLRAVRRRSTTAPKPR